MEIRLRLSPLTLGIAVYIIVSGFFMRQVLGFLQEQIGRPAIGWSLWILLAAGAAAVAWHLWSTRPGAARVMVFLLLLAAGFLFAARMKITEERFHLIKFGLLGWLVYSDIILPKNPFLRLLPALFFCLAVGAVDEIFQFYNPLRVGDIRDVLFAGIGGLWGAGLYLTAVKEKGKILGSN